MIDFDKELDDGFDAWYNGWYTTSEPDVVVHAFESVMNQPDDDELREDPGLIGAVYYTIYDLQMYGIDEAHIKEWDGGLFEYHKGCTFGELCDFIGMAHGVEIEDRITGRLEEALINAEEEL